MLQSGGLVPLLFSNNSFGEAFSCDVRTIRYTVEYFTVTNYFKQKGDNSFRKSGSLSGPRCRECSHGSQKTGAVN